MRNLIKQILDIDPIVTIITTLVGAIVFLFMTFTTFGYVDAKHESVVSILQDIRESVKTTEDRVFELYKERR